MSRAPAGRGSGVEGRGYQQLRAWQSAHRLALAAFGASEQLRSRHSWLANQLVRAAVSVAANVAEGYNRGSIREYIQFLTIARGSLAEVEYHVLFAREAALISAETAAEMTRLVDDTGNPLLGLIRSLQAKAGLPARVVKDAASPYDLIDAAVFEPATLDPRPATRPEPS